MKRTRVLILLCMLLSGCGNGSTYQEIYQSHLSSNGQEQDFVAILPFYKEEIEKDIYMNLHHAGDMRSFLKLDHFDMDGDGIDEILVYFINWETCGHNRCSIDIYKIAKTGNPFKVAGLFGSEEYSILLSKSHGYHDIALYGWLDGKEMYGVWKYDGNEYQFAERVLAAQVFRRPR